MFSLEFIGLWLFLLVLLIFQGFKEYQFQSNQTRYVSPTKVNLWMMLTYAYFFNYLHAIIFLKVHWISTLIGALGSLFLASVIIFSLYSKMSKACQIFFAKRYGIIFILSLMAVFTTSWYLGILCLGFAEVSYEIYRLNRGQKF